MQTWMLAATPLPTPPEPAMPAGDLLDLADRPWLKRSFAPPAMVAPPPPLLLDTPAICDASIAATHLSVAGPVAALGCYALADALLAGPCHVALDCTDVIAPDLTPIYWQRALQDGTLGDTQRPDLPIRPITDPPAVIATPGYQEYGHWLLDILPRLWTLAAANPQPPDGLRIALPSDTPAFGRALLARLGIPPEHLLTHDPNAERLAPQTLLLPSLAHTDYRLHPASAAFYDTLVIQHAAPGPPGPTHLFLSRAQYSRPNIPGRHLLNHDDARALLEACGFTTIQPERLSWPEQLALFAGARVIVGEHGSAMKNLVFTPPGAVVINIHRLNHTQSHIAALRRHHLIYLRAENLTQAPTGRMEYRVDIPALARCITAAFDHLNRP